MFIQTKYSGLNEDTLAAMMNSRSWKYYTQRQRLELLQEMEIRMARKQGREPLLVKTFQPERGNAGLMGYFSTGDSRYLYLNENYVISKPSRLHDYSVAAALSTLIHEGRHAYQYAVACGRCPAPDEETCQRWKLNYAHYMNCGGDSESQMLYVQQSLERDARTYALNELEGFYAKMRMVTGCDDFQYQRTLDGQRRREEAYRELAKTLLTRQLLDEVDRRAREAFERVYPGEALKVSIFDEMRRSLDRLQEMQIDQIRKYANYDVTLDRMLRKLEERAAREAGYPPSEALKFAERRVCSCVL